MNNIELRATLHSFIDKLDNTSLLKEYYNELKKIITISQGRVWDTLSEDQKKQVLLSFEESEDEANLLDNDAVMGKYKKWF